MKIFIILKKNILTIIFLFFLIFLVVFSNNNLAAAGNGLALWSKCVVPSLFPFFIATELLNYTNFSNLLGKLLHKIMRPLFNVPGEGAYAFIMGIISGYPVGAKIVSDFYEKDICSKNEAERMLAFTNNSGPLFIIGTVGVLLFGNSSIGLLLFITHILASITVGIILGIKSRLHIKSDRSEKKLILNSFQKSDNIIENDSISNIGNIIASSISKSISTTLQIGGFIVLFSVIISILNKLNIITYICDFFSIFGIPKSFSNSLISGIIELTNGVNFAANLHEKNISVNIILCSFLLGFGGFCVLLQVLGIVSKVNLSIKKYLYGKLLQGLIAALYTSIFINNFSIFNFDIKNTAQGFNANFYSLALFLVSMLFVLTIFFYHKKTLNHNSKLN